jgi:hypothetical protein
MARRSALNERYQKNTSPAGKTRRSASSAKPKREAGSATSAGAKPKKKAANRPSWREAMAAMPSTPEMKRWRWVWIGLILLALVIAAGIAFIPALRGNRTALYVGSALYVASLGGAVYIDFAVIRKLRAQAMAARKPSGKKGG